MPAASEAVVAPGGGGGDGDGDGDGDAEQQFVIRNDEGFVYKVPSGLYPDAAPSSTQPAEGPDPKAAALRRRRRALLRLRAKRLRDLARWEALASELLAPLPAPQPPASPPASSHPDAAAASSSSSPSILDDLIAQVDKQADLMKKAWEWCDEANKLCDAHEAAIVDSIAPVPLWGGDPKELMAGLCSPEEKTASGNLDEQNGCQEAPGVSSAAAEMIKNTVRKKNMGHDLPTPIVTESRTRKRVTNLSGSNSVASQASIESKRRKASGSTSTATGTPGSTTRRKTTSTPARVPDIVCSPGPLTRRRASEKMYQNSPQNVL